MLSEIVSLLKPLWQAQLGLLLVALPVVSVLVWIIYARTFHPLANIRGPWLATWSRLWYMKKIWSEDVEVDQKALREDHGPLVRIAYDGISCSERVAFHVFERLCWSLLTRFISCASLEAIHQIYRCSNTLDNAPFYGPCSTTGFSKHGDVFSKSSDKDRGQRRRIVNNVYSMTNVSKGEQYVEVCSQLFIQRLENGSTGTRNHPVSSSHRNS